MESLRTMPRGDEDQEYLRHEAELESRRRKDTLDGAAVNNAYSPITKENIKVWH